MRQDQLEEFVDQVAEKWQMGGLDNSTMYGEFAVEVAKLAVAAEREACALACDARRIADECVEGDWDRGYNMALLDCNAAILAL